MEPKNLKATWKQNWGLQKMPRNLKEMDGNLTLLFPHILSHANVSEQNI